MAKREGKQMNHKIQWWVYARDGLGGVEKMRRSSTMRGPWGYDVTCSCGWETRTGGATLTSVREDVYWHKLQEG